MGKLFLASCLCHIDHPLELLKWLHCPTSPESPDESLYEVEIGVQVNQQKNGKNLENMLDPKIISTWDFRSNLSSAQNDFTQRDMTSCDYFSMI